jgi:hypothetical protein
MKKYLLMIVVCVGLWATSATSAHAAIAVVHSAGSASSNTVNITSTTAGNLLVIGFGIVTTTATVTKVCTDGATCAAGNSFTQVPGARSVGSANETDMWYLPNVAAGKTVVTITLSAGTADSAVVTELSGVVTSNPIDLVSTGTSGIGVNNSGAKINNTNPDSILVGYEEISTSISAVASPFALQGGLPNGNTMVTALPLDTDGLPPIYGTGGGNWSSSGVSFLPVSTVTTFY